MTSCRRHVTPGPTHCVNGKSVNELKIGLNGNANKNKNHLKKPKETHIQCQWEVIFCREMTRGSKSKS